MASLKFSTQSSLLVAPWLLLCSAAFCLSFSVAHAAKVTARTSEISLPTYGWAAVKHPYFRGTDGRNIYPYPMIDFLSRDKTNCTYRTVILENEYLRITFLPELGGKIHEVLDKTTGQPMFYVNNVVKPGLIGQCGAWTSGGIEWNTGPQGHTVSCMQPVDVVVLPPEKDGSRSVAIGETERIYRTKWTVVVTLRPGRSFIEERIRIYNPTETVRPYYFWNCTAVPNTPGFRFIYPMTLGCDHAGEKFFNWPVDNGKDLTRGTNYQDASSIFAWHCDQDFFGAYLDDLDRGVVAHANHHQLPGKKAWTWGQGGFGKMHQMDLTDDDGPYNEVQTGPLLTQAQVGRLDPCEAVEWKEWWYPVHGIGGFTFANQDVAVNASHAGGRLQLKILGTARWTGVDVKVSKSGRQIGSSRCDIAALKPTEVTLELAGEQEPFEVEFSAGQVHLARFRVPLSLPIRTPPEKKSPLSTASEFAQAGWQEFLFARFVDAEVQFRKALEADPRCVEANTGLAWLNLDRDPTASASAAKAGLQTDPDCGRARFVLAAAEYRLGHEESALEEAWKATLDPATAVAGRALVAKLLLRKQDLEGAIKMLSAPGPWQADTTCRSRLALALVRNGEKQQARQLCGVNLSADPLDYLAQSIGGLAGEKRVEAELRRSLFGRLQPVMDLAGDYAALNDSQNTLRILEEFYAGVTFEHRSQNPVPIYWAAALSEHAGLQESTSRYLQKARLQNTIGVFPSELEAMPSLRWALERDAQDGKVALHLGHLLFHLGRHAEGREMWKRAAELGAEPVIAYRALGMAAKTLDKDLKSAREWLEKANQADPKDSIVARDLANVLFALADKADSDAEKRTLATEARDRLKVAFEEGKGRSDFVALLARAQNRLDEFAETARLLDGVRVTIWEGAHEVHDLFVQSHLVLGEAHLKAGRAAEALAEFNRALEYPENLATGRLENAREAHIHYQRGNALAALGRKTEAADAWKLAAEEPESGDARIAEARKKAKEALEKLVQ